MAKLKVVWSKEANEKFYQIALYYNRLTSMEKLSKYKSSTPSKWREEAEFRLANKDWLRYSQHIAMMMLDKMEELGMTQKALAQKWDAASNMFQKS